MPDHGLTYSPMVEEALLSVWRLLRGEYRISRRSLSLLLILGDDGALSLVRDVEPERYPEIASVVGRIRARNGPALETSVQQTRNRFARSVAGEAITSMSPTGATFAERLSNWCTRPATGVPILLLVVATGLYGFVGVLGGQVLVGLLEEGLFEGLVNPAVSDWVRGTFHALWLERLLVGEYGIWTLGVTYAFALILPLVGTFFLAFSVLEDSGYLPRLALLVDRVFKYLGLNGRAVIPIVLGFGCDTMATIVTRILETRRERLLATFLLSLAIPCSAQLGVMTGLLAGRPIAFVIWAGIMTATFLLVGYLAARVIPGERADFVLELPPLRWPSPANVATKTLARMHWYFLEVIPLFVLASVILWFADMTGLLRYALAAMHPIATILGLPPEAGEAFLFGFFRRDYGAAGLYRLHEHHGLTGNQQLVAVVTLTLFLPCVAQLLVMRKERGTRTALAILAFILPFALTAGTLLNWSLRVLGISL